MIVRTGLGQDSHRFSSGESSKVCVMGGLIFEGCPGFSANSDGDVILHAICNAISSVTGVRILGDVADELLEKDGIVDSAVYLEHAMKTLGQQKISHLAISIEAHRPRLGTRVDELRQNIAQLMGIEFSQVGLTATSGEGLTNFGLGDGVQVLCVLTTVE